VLGAARARRQPERPSSLLCLRVCVLSLSN